MDEWTEDDCYDCFERPDDYNVFEENCLAEDREFEDEDDEEDFDDHPPAALDERLW